MTDHATLKMLQDDLSVARSEIEVLKRTHTIELANIANLTEKVVADTRRARESAEALSKRAEEAEGRLESLRVLLRFNLIRETIRVIRGQIWEYNAKGFADHEDVVYLREKEAKLVEFETPMLKLHGIQAFLTQVDDLAAR